MAVAFNLQRRGVSEHNYFPEEITVNEEMNGRHELPDIEWLIESMLKPHGQLQPILIRREQGNPVLVAGYSRWRAVVAINERGLAKAGRIPLRCSYTAMDETQAFIANIEENHVRNQTTPIDDAYNIQRLINIYHKSEADVADIFHESTAWIRARLSMIDLASEAQEAIAEGRVKDSAAKAIGKLSKSLQRKAAKIEGPITVKAVKALVSGPVKPKPPKIDAELKIRLTKLIESAPWSDYVEAESDYIIVSAEALVCLKNYVLGE